MGIKVGESNKKFRYATGYDMSSSTALSLLFTDPSGIESTIDSSAGKVTAPAGSVSDPDLGSLLGDMYMEFDIEATDFTVAGTWTVCGTYTNTGTTPDSIYIGDSATFAVSAC